MTDSIPSTEQAREALEGFAQDRFSVLVPIAQAYVDGRLVDKSVQLSGIGGQKSPLVPKCPNCEDGYHYTDDGGSSMGPGYFADPCPSCGGSGVNIPKAYKRDECCADWPKPCSYHEGWDDAIDVLLAVFKETL